VPGQVALYLGRPVNGGARGYVLPWTGTAFEYLVEEAWIKVAEGGSICCEYDYELQRCIQTEAPTTWSGRRFYRRLQEASDVLTGAFQLTTFGMAGGSVVGEAAAAPGTMTLTRRIPH